MVSHVLALTCSLLAGGGDLELGGDRPVVVHVPECYDPAVPIPVFVNLHGFTSSGVGQESYWRMRPLGEERCFVYLYPDGTRNAAQQRFWEATDACCGFGSGVDDSGYLRGLLDEIATVVNVDRDRIHFMGLSNGGFMSHRMACDHSDVVAAIASQAGAAWLDPASCDATDTVSVLQIHGTADATIRYDGGRFNIGEPYPSATDTVQQWALSNDCLVPSIPVDLRLDLDTATPGADTSILRHEDCRTGGAAELWTIVNGSHVPALTPATTTAASTNMAALVTEWLLAHPKRPAPEASFDVSSGDDPFELVFTASSTVPPGAAIARHVWEFGDGELGSGVTVAHRYTSPGRRAVSLRVVTDDDRVSPMVRGGVTTGCREGDVGPWTTSAIGTPAFPGAASLEDGRLRLCAGGDDLVGSEESGVLVHQESRGDVRVTARVLSLDGAIASATGLMLRESLASDARFGAMVLERRGSGAIFRFRHRELAGGRTRSTRGDTVDDPTGWLRLERSGGILRGLSSPDGVSWTLVGEVAVELSEVLLGGVAGFGRDSGRVPYSPLGAVLSDIEIESLVTPPPSFLRGDCDGDGAVAGNLSDAVANLTHCFFGAGVPCLAACDVDGDGRACSGVTDGLRLLLFAFLGAEAPPAPYPDCGPPTASNVALGCGASACP